MYSASTLEGKEGRVLRRYVYRVLNPVHSFLSFFIAHSAC